VAAVNRTCDDQIAEFRRYLRFEQDGTRERFEAEKVEPFVWPDQMSKKSCPMCDGKGWLLVANEPV
jgi:hypothetical protein